MTLESVKIESETYYNLTMKGVGKTPKQNCSFLKASLAHMNFKHPALTTQAQHQRNSQASMATPAHCSQQLLSGVIAVKYSQISLIDEHAFYRRLCVAEALPKYSSSHELFSRR